MAEDLTQDDINALLGSIDEDNPSPDETSQDEIDVLLGGLDESPQKEEIRQDEIDALLGGLDEPGEEAESSSSVLEQDEVDRLLGAIEEGSDAESEESFEADGPRVKIYDFIRPDIISQSQLQEVHHWMDQFMTHFTQFLSAQTAGNFTFEITSLDMLTLDELLRCQPNPSWCCSMDFSREAQGSIFIPENRSIALWRILMGLEPQPKENDSLRDGQLFSAINQWLMGITEQCLDSMVFKPRVGRTHWDIQSLDLGDPLELQLCGAVLLCQRDLDWESQITLALPVDMLLSKMKKIMPANANDDVPLSRELRFRLWAHREQIENQQIPTRGDETGSLFFKGEETK